MSASRREQNASQDVQSTRPASNTRHLTPPFRHWGSQSSRSTRVWPRTLWGRELTITTGPSRMSGTTLSTLQPRGTASSKTLLCQHMSGNSSEGGSSTIWSGGSSNRPPSTAKNQVGVISVWKRRQPSCSPTRRHHWTKGRKSCKSAATERNTCWSTNNWPFFKKINFKVRHS